jgi:hypothetical protein
MRCSRLGCEARQRQRVAKRALRLAIAAAVAAVAAVVVEESRKLQIAVGSQATHGWTAPPLEKVGQERLMDLRPLV